MYTVHTIHEALLHCTTYTTVNRMNELVHLHSKIDDIEPNQTEQSNMVAEADSVWRLQRSAVAGVLFWIWLEA